MRATLLLEDGTVFTGSAVHPIDKIIGRVVFHTGVVGFESVITDPSSQEDIIVFTYPHIGNYGYVAEDLYSPTPQARAVVVKKLSPAPSNWRSTGALGDFFNCHRLPVMTEVDTRSLTVHLREHGEMRGIISTEEHDPAQLMNWLLSTPDKRLLSGEPALSPPPPAVSGGTAPLRATVINLGVNRAILAELAGAGFEVTLVPPTATREDILQTRPSGVIFAGGPGNPTEEFPFLTQVCRSLLGNKPVLGIGSGHLVVGASLGARVTPMKVGHHGFNQAIQSPGGKAEITAQYHSYCLDASSIDPEVAEVTWVNMVDRTVEGIKSVRHPCFTVQYYPLSSSEGKIHPDIAMFAHMCLAPESSERK